ncbi:MAG: hypothetical protein FWF52_04155 [Candidatus Azobacteroides sp.]|nr:hypothetical protein [Candidatus Azobacteroides sp.]
MKTKLLTTFFCLVSAIWIMHAQDVNTENEKDENEKRGQTSIEAVDLLADTTVQNQKAIRTTGKYHRKIPALALGLSVLYPGIGQFYNGQVGKGLLMCGISTISGFCFLGIYARSFDETKQGYGLFYNFMWPFFAVWVGNYIWSLMDAPISAHAINRKHQALSWNLGNDRTLSITPNVLSFNSRGIKKTNQSMAYGLSFKLDF